MAIQIKLLYINGFFNRDGQRGNYETHANLWLKEHSHQIIDIKILEGDPKILVIYDDTLTEPVYPARRIRPQT